MNNIINQPWLGLLGLAIAISAALKALWETPFFTTFWVVMALYLGFSVWKQVKDGVTTALEGIQKAGVFAIAVVIFYILQKSLGVIERALGPVGEKDQELLFIWGLIAALIAGGLAFAWIKQKRGMVIVALGVVFPLLILQLGFPKYTATWANRDEARAILEEKGVGGALWDALGTFWQGKRWNKPPPAVTAPATQRIVQQKVEMVEMLEKVFEKYTPCSGFVGWGCVVRSDGYPLRIKYNNCNWVEISGKGEGTATPETFRPGEAEFVSPDPLHPVRVRVYKKVIVQKVR